MSGLGPLGMTLSASRLAISDCELRAFSMAASRYRGVHDNARVGSEGVERAEVEARVRVKARKGGKRRAMVGKDGLKSTTLENVVGNVCARSARGSETVQISWTDSPRSW